MKVWEDMRTIGMPDYLVTFSVTETVLEPVVSVSVDVTLEAPVVSCFVEVSESEFALVV